MIVDSSAWIDFLRQRRSPVGSKLRASIADSRTQLLTTDVIRLEVLSGADRQPVRSLINSALAGCESVTQLPMADVDDAIELFQFCRRRGETITSPNDCLIAAIAIRVDAPVLHADRDFEVLTRHTALRSVALS